MKLALSYFYQIRNFKPYMIPVSTAFGDPAWYHAGLGKTYNYLDKRGVVNGLRCEELHGDDSCNSEVEVSCPCEYHKIGYPGGCPAMVGYRQHLEELDLDSFMNRADTAANDIQTRLEFKEEPIIVLMVHEAPDNPCSERQSLLDYFNSHNIPIEELKYPIKENYT